MHVARKGSRRRGVVVQGHQPVIGHGHDAVLRFLPERAEPLLVFQVADPFGMAEGMKLFQKHVFKLCQLAQHPLGRGVE